MQTAIAAEARWDSDPSNSGWVVELTTTDGHLTVAAAPSVYHASPDTDPARVVAETLRWWGYTLVTDMSLCEEPHEMITLTEKQLYEDQGDGYTVARHTLGELGSHPDGLTAAELGDLVGDLEDGHQMGACLRRLHVDGLVTKTPVSPGSLRVRWHLTDAGRAHITSPIEPAPRAPASLLDDEEWEPRNHAPVVDEDRWEEV